MSLVFYDKLISFERIEIHIKSLAQTTEEREELWQIVDELIHQRVLDWLLAKLPREHHEDFLGKFIETPYDEGLFNYLKEKIEADIEKLLKQEIEDLASEILDDILR